LLIPSSFFFLFLEDTKLNNLGFGESHGLLQRISTWAVHGMRDDTAEAVGKQG
jgi:hypothetical protein